MSEHEQRMPFGKHKGTLIKELPGDYLRWLGTIELHGPLRAAVTSALKAKAEQMPLSVAGTTPEQGTPALASTTPSPARSKAAQGTFPGIEAAKPRPKSWRRPEGEDLSAYYSANSNDGIPW